MERFVGMRCVARVGMALRSSRQPIEEIGDPGRTRTSDLQLRRLLLYPLSYGAVARIDALALDIMSFSIAPKA
jgi:hypothetical protein